MQNFMKTVISAVQTWVDVKIDSLNRSIDKKTETAADSEIVNMLIDDDLLLAVTDSDGSILSTEGSIILW